MLRVAAVEHSKLLPAHGILEADSDHTIDHDRKREYEHFAVQSILRRHHSLKTWSCPIEELL